MLDEKAKKSDGRRVEQLLSRVPAQCPALLVIPQKLYTQYIHNADFFFYKYQYGPYLQLKKVSPPPVSQQKFGN